MATVEGRVLLDTNVLIYATLRTDPRSETARKLFLGENTRQERYISVQNLAEMYPNLTGPKTDPPDSPEIASRKIEAIAHLRTIQVMPLTADIQKLSLELCRKYNVRKQRYFDIQLVATMLTYGIPTLITENVADFMEIEEIRTVNPF